MIIKLTEHMYRNVTCVCGAMIVEGLKLFRGNEYFREILSKRLSKLQCRGWLATNRINVKCSVFNSTLNH